MEESKETKVQKLGYKDYNDYLNSQQWITRKSSFRKKNKEKCFICDGYDNECNLHHLTYERLGKELNSDLIWLCDFHHNEIHNIKDGKVYTPMPTKDAHISMRNTFYKYNLSSKCGKKQLRVKDDTPLRVLSRKQRKKKPKEYQVTLPNSYDKIPVAWNHHSIYRDFTFLNYEVDELCLLDEDVIKEVLLKIKQYSIRLDYWTVYDILTIFEYNLADDIKIKDYC